MRREWNNPEPAHHERPERKPGDFAQVQATRVDANAQQPAALGNQARGQPIPRQSRPQRGGKRGICQNPDHHRGAAQQRRQPRALQAHRLRAQIPENENPVQKHIQPDACHHDPERRPGFRKRLAEIFRRSCDKNRNERPGAEEEIPARPAVDFIRLAEDPEVR